jgi:hypothetical protein
MEATLFLCVLRPDGQSPSLLRFFFLIKRRKIKEKRTRVRFSTECLYSLETHLFDCIFTATELFSRATGLFLDFIHRLVCGRQKIPQRFGDWICLRPQVDGAG